MENKIIDGLDPNDALAILKRLAKEDADLAQRIEQIGLEYLSGVDVEDVADQVYFELDTIPVEEVWDRSGSTREGYIEPTEMAYEMFEEALEPFMHELKKYQQLSMRPEAKRYCMGILKGIYRSEKESESEYKEWAVDAPFHYSARVLDEWKKSSKDPDAIGEVEEFVRRELSGW